MHDFFSFSLIHEVEPFYKNTGSYPASSLQLSHTLRVVATRRCIALRASCVFQTRMDERPSRRSEERGYRKYRFSGKLYPSDSGALTGAMVVGGG